MLTGKKTWAFALFALCVGACRSDPIADIRRGKVEAVERALSRGKLAADGADPSGKPLLLVAYEADQPAVGKLLLEKGADPNVPGAGGQPLLHEAIASGKRAWVSALVASHRLDVNARAAGASPLQVALRRGDAASADALLARGANPFLPARTVQSVLEDGSIPEKIRERFQDQLARAAPPSPEALAKAFAAAAAYDAPALRAFLAGSASPGLASSADDQGRTILMAAVSAGAADATHVLLDRGADLHATRFDEGRFVAALDLAKDPAIAALLRDHGARPVPERKAEVIIAAGARTREELTPVLSALAQAPFPYAPGFPAVVLSDRIPGLNPGWHVVLVGVCEEGPLARAWAASFRESVQGDRKDAYVRTVTLRTEQFACPEAGGRTSPAVQVETGDGTTLVAQVVPGWAASVELHDGKGALLDWKWTAAPPPPAPGTYFECGDPAIAPDGEGGIVVSYGCLSPGCTSPSSDTYFVTWKARKGKLRSTERHGEHRPGECDD